MTSTILAPIAALQLPDAAAMEQRAQSALSFIRDMPVVDAESYSLAADELKAIKVRANALEEQRTAITGPMNKALKAVNDLFRKPSQYLEDAERLLKGKMLEYTAEQQRKLQEARRVAEAAAEAERRRLADEAAARAAEAKAAEDAAEAARKAGDQQAAALAQAEAARAQAQASAATTTAQMTVAQPVAVQAAPAVKGISTAAALDFEVTDLHALIKHIAERPELVSLVTADSVKLRAYVKSLGMACNLPGVRVSEKRVMRAA